jgi:hypothetical protein
MLMNSSSLFFRERLQYSPEISDLVLHLRCSTNGLSFFPPCAGRLPQEYSGGRDIRLSLASRLWNILCDPPRNRGEHTHRNNPAVHPHEGLSDRCRAGGGEHGAGPARLRGRFLAASHDPSEQRDSFLGGLQGGGHVAHVEHGDQEWAALLLVRTRRSANLDVSSLTRVRRVTLAFNILVVVMFVAPGVPPVLRATFTNPHLALENSMATRVFRMLRFDARSSALETAPISSGSRRSGSRPLHPANETAHGMIIFRNKTDTGAETGASTHDYEGGFVKPADLSV